MSLKLVMASGQIRHFKTALQCLAKLGSEVLVEAIPEKLILRCINTSKSAFMAVTFYNTFFESYNVYDTNVAQAGVLMKGLLSTFRTQKVTRMALDLSTGDDAKLAIKLECDNGLVKQLLSSFHHGLEEITIIANPDGGGGGINNRACELRSFIDPAKGQREKSLNTAVSVDARAVFQSYRHESDGSTDVTFNLKDFRAIVSLCEHMSANLFIAFDQPGVPLLAQPHFGGVQEVDYDAELVLATLMESQMESQQPPPADTAAATTSGMGAGQQGAGQGTSYVPGDTPWRADGRTPMSRRAGAANTPAAERNSNHHAGAGPSRLGQPSFTEPAQPSTSHHTRSHLEPSFPSRGPRTLPQMDTSYTTAEPSTHTVSHVDPSHTTTRHTHTGEQGGPEDADYIRFQARTGRMNVDGDRDSEDVGRREQGAEYTRGAMGDPDDLPGMGLEVHVPDAEMMVADSQEGGEEEDEEEEPPTPPEKRLRSAGPGIISTLP